MMAFNLALKDERGIRKGLCDGHVGKGVQAGAVEGGSGVWISCVMHLGRASRGFSSGKGLLRLEKENAVMLTLELLHLLLLRGKVIVHSLITICPVLELGVHLLT